MNPLQRALIEKLGHDHGFEHVLPGEETAVVLASALHSAQIVIRRSNADEFFVEIQSAIPALASEVTRALPDATQGGAKFRFRDEAGLARMLRRTAALAQALPHQPVQNYEVQIDAALKALPTGDIATTEIERLIRQRVGQRAFREAMLHYWNGACAVTGVKVSEVLRASHAKPWAECESDEERLDVFNGFLLCAHLDALFDRFLISFDDEGRLLLSPTVSSQDQATLGLDQSLRLRWLTPMHRMYLLYHRERFNSVSAAR